MRISLRLGKRILAGAKACTPANVVAEQAAGELIACTGRAAAALRKARRKLNIGANGSARTGMRLANCWLLAAGLAKHSI
jgi:hypothetical protein